MIRDGMRRRVLALREQREKDRIRQERLQVLEAQWQHYSLPVQAELRLHAELYGIDATEHLLTIVARLLP